MPQNKSVMNLRSEQGSLAINDTALHTNTKHWAQFVVIVDAAIAAIVMPKEESDASAYLGVIYPQGFVFDGPIESITLASGTVRVYNFIDRAQAAAINP